MSSEPTIVFGPKTREKIPEPLTFLKCLSCGVENSRPFEEGDYVLKVVNSEKCPKCGGAQSKIVNIYVPQKKESK
jgi:Zn finger protein HypA/HybF involved in hydrogenase expression